MQVFPSSYNILDLDIYTNYKCEKIKSTTKQLKDTHLFQPQQWYSYNHNQYLTVSKGYVCVFYSDEENKTSSVCISISSTHAGTSLKHLLCGVSQSTFLFSTKRRVFNRTIIMHTWYCLKCVHRVKRLCQ